METKIAEAPFDATRVARLLSSPEGVRVALVNLVTGAEFFSVPLAARTRESVVAALGVVNQLRARLAAAAPPPMPFSQRFGAGSAEELRPRPRKRRQGLNLVRAVEYTDSGIIHTERSAFSGSNAWAAQLVPVAINAASGMPRDYDYRFLTTDDSSKSRSGRTGHANYDLRGEPDGVYVAESVWRSGKPQRVYFEVIDESVVRHTEDIDEARSWMGLDEPLAAKIARLRAEQAERDRASADAMKLAPLQAASEKQRDYAERVRAAFVQRFQTKPPPLRSLWPAVARANSAKWWLDYGNVQRDAEAEILRRLVGAWIAADPKVAIETAAAAMAAMGFDEIVEDAGRSESGRANAVRDLRAAIKHVVHGPDGYMGKIATLTSVDQAARPALRAAFGEALAAELSRLLAQAIASGELPAVEADAPGG